MVLGLSVSDCCWEAVVGTVMLELLCFAWLSVGVAVVLTGEVDAATEVVICAVANCGVVEAAVAWVAEIFEGDK